MLENRASWSSLSRCLVALWVASAAFTGMAPVEAKGPKDLKGKDAAVIRILVNGHQDLDRLTPGETVELDIQAEDRRGRSYSLADGTLGTKFLTITPTLGRLDLAARTFTPERERAAVGEGAYGLHVVFGPEGKSAESNASFTPDFAAIEGPQPTDVRAMSVEVDGQSLLGYAVPGQPLRLRVRVLAAGGRTFVTGASRDRIPVDRLEIAAKNMTVDAWSLTVTGNSDLDVARFERYQVTVRYKGRPDLDVTNSFVPDVAMIIGPEPADVRSVVLDITDESGRTPAERVAPGRPLQVAMRVIDNLGRSHAVVNGKVGEKNVVVRTENMLADGTTTLTPLGTKESVGKHYTVSAWYEGREDLVQSLAFEPDFEAPLAPYLLRTDRIAALGSAGARGTSGPEGPDGRSGRDAIETHGTGQDGMAAGPGRPGGRGGKGAKGPKVRILAMAVLSADRQNRYVLSEVTVGNSQPYFALKSVDAPPMEVVSVGGDGGFGGAGGRGGDGGEGGVGDCAGSGGAGGTGGPGGGGGDGGPGGDIAIVATSDLALSAFEPDSRGGEGGHPGNGGSGGEGGKVPSTRALILGAVSAFANALAGNVQPTPMCPDAEIGEVGESGDAGMDGAEGLPGAIDARIGTEAAAIRSRLPDNLKASVIFEDDADAIAANRPTE